MNKSLPLPLPPDQITKLLHLLRKTARFIIDLRITDSLAGYIQLPKIPSKLSESIVCHAIASGQILVGGCPLRRVWLAGKAADIMIELSDDQQKKIEIKASGEAGFSEFGTKDITCDYLVWLDFGDVLTSTKTDKITAYVLATPSNHFKERTKITLPKFLNLLGSTLEKYTIDVATLTVNRAALGIVDIFADQDGVG